MNTNAAIGLIIAGAAFVLAHAFVYTLGGVYFKELNIYYAVLFFLELVPTLYTEGLLGVVFIDRVLPELSATTIQYTQLQRSMYFFKPYVEVIAIVCLVLEVLPSLVGIYIWKFSESDSE